MVNVEATALSKAYRRRMVLQPTSFVAEPGTLTALVGPNGAGKTTLLKRMTEIIRGDGTTHFGGRRWHELPYPRQVVGLYLGNHPFHSGIRVVDHLHLIAAAAPGAERRIDEVLERFGLEQHRTTRVARLSMGMRQRLGLASALLPEPPVLLLDEPFSALDPSEATSVYEWIAELARDRGNTVILSTHQLHRIAPFATHALFLRDGRLCAQGSLAEIAAVLDLSPVLHLAVANPLKLVDALTSAGALAHMRSGSVITVADLGPAAALAVARQHDLPVHAWWHEEPSLATIYQELM